MRILALDCQTTGGAANGHLLELGWALANAAEIRQPHPAPAPRIRSHLVQLPETAPLTPRITQLTGITDAAMTSAVTPETAWEELVADSAGADRAPFGSSVSVVHFARFEYPFLRKLQLRVEPQSSFPFHLVCAHEIARRLYPDLPRASLRALAGYCGLTLPESKRAGDHVRATLLVWSHLVEELSRRRGVGSFEELTSLLREPVPPRQGKWSYPLPRESRLSLPTSPGVYRFLARDRSVLYVGKATSLKKRVNSYFQKRSAPQKVRELLAQIHDVEVSVTPNAIDAALLESKQIRTLSPPYNTALRDHGQKVFFFDRELRTAGRHGTNFPVGPLPQTQSLRMLQYLAQQMNGTSSEAPAALRDATAMPPSATDRREVKLLARELGLEDTGVDEELLGQALGLIHAEGSSHTNVTVRSLLASGTRHLKGSASAKELSTEADNSDDQETVGAKADNPAFRLTIPETKGATTPLKETATATEVASALREFLAQTSRVHRRAAWLRFLSGSQVRWRSGDDEDWEVVTTTHDVGRRWSRAAYDHYRVLTTELRRLVGEGAEIEVRGPSGRILRQPWIQRVLQRV